MPKTTPADEEVIPPASPESQALEVPETPPEVPPEEVIEEAPAPPPVEPQAPTEDEQAILKKRLSGALQENEKRSEELRRAKRLQVDMVRESPNYIHRIAEEDPSMANKVIQEVWGSEGIRSYKQLQEHIKLQEIRTVDPEAYETKKELLEVKSKLDAREEREQIKLRKDFLKSKGISDNPYDPNFKKLEDSISLLNPQLIKDDYEQALNLAWNLVSDPAPSPSSPKPTINAGGGISAVPPVRSSSGKTELSWVYDQWKQQK